MFLRPFGLYFNACLGKFRSITDEIFETLTWNKKLDKEFLKIIVFSAILRQPEILLLCYSA
jgi:hypothetical protein